MYTFLFNYLLALINILFKNYLNNFFTDLWFLRILQISLYLKNCSWNKRSSHKKEVGMCSLEIPLPIQDSWLLATVILFICIFVYWFINWFTNL